MRDSLPGTDLLFINVGLVLCIWIVFAALKSRGTSGALSIVGAFVVGPIVNLAANMAALGLYATIAAN